MELLKELFIKLQETDERAISPEYDLAYMALLNEKDEEAQVEETDNKENEDTLSDLKKDDAQQDDLNKEESVDLKVEDTDMLDLVDKELPLPPSPSVLLEETPGTDSDIENAFRHTSFTTEIPPPTDSPPSYSDIVTESDMTPFKDEKSLPEEDLSVVVTPEVSKVKERPSVDTMMFGKQQDVTGK